MPARADPICQIPMRVRAHGSFTTKKSHQILTSFLHHRSSGADPPVTPDRNLSGRAAWSTSSAAAAVAALASCSVHRRPRPSSRARAGCEHDRHTRRHPRRDARAVAAHRQSARAASHVHRPRARRRARNARLSARQLREHACGGVGRVLGGVMGGLGRRHRFDVDGGERRREVEQRHDFDVPLLEAARGAAGKVSRAAARRTLEVHVHDSCVSSALSNPLSRQDFLTLSLARPPHPRASQHGSSRGRRSAFGRARVCTVRPSGFIFVFGAELGLRSPSCSSSSPTPLTYRQQ